MYLLSITFDLFGVLHVWRTQGACIYIYKTDVRSNTDVEVSSAMELLHDDEPAPLPSG